MRWPSTSWAERPEGQRRTILDAELLRRRVTHHGRTRRYHPDARARASRSEHRRDRGARTHRHHPGSAGCETSSASASHGAQGVQAEQGGSECKDERGGAREARTSRAHPTRYMAYIRGNEATTPPSASRLNASSFVLLFRARLRMCRARMSRAPSELPMARMEVQMSSNSFSSRLTCLRTCALSACPRSTTRHPPNPAATRQCSESANCRRTVARDLAGRRRRRDDPLSTAGAKHAITPSQSVGSTTVAKHASRAAVEAKGRWRPQGAALCQFAI